MTNRKRVVTLLTTLLALVLVPAAAVSAGQVSRSAGPAGVTLDVAAQSDIPRSAGPVKALIFGFCDDNTPLRSQPNETSSNLGTCQRSHIIDVICYVVNPGTPPPATYGNVDDRTINVVGWGRGDRISVPRLPPPC